MDFAAVSQGYAQHSADARGIVRHELVERRLLAEAATLPKQTVLDVGCGDGEMSLRLARRGFEVLGVDDSPQMIVQARDRLAGEPASVRRRVSFEHAAVGSTGSLGTFGLVCCHGVLLYLPESMPAASAPRSPAVTLRRSMKSGTGGSAHRATWGSPLGVMTRTSSTAC
jgi:2-polyprenyl-3-methyl-5-hydroxy-6-metoxy-1,4-benzoquinol methylase